MSKNMDYPVIKIPSVYTKMHKAIPGKVYPQLSAKPQSVGKNLLCHFEKDAVFTIFSFLAPVIIISSILSIMLGGVNKDFALVIGSMFSISVLGILFAGISMLETINFYIPALYHYKRDVELQNSEYASKVKKYEKDVKKWEKLEIKAKDDTYLLSYRRKYLPESIKAYSGKIVSHPGHSYVKKGSMEGKVLEILQARFGNKILINHTTHGQPVVPLTFIPSKNKAEVVVVNRFSPLPDFLVHDPNIGYCVVIEIDEPYDLEYGYPIHSIESNDLRDNYFVERSWPVIRFAEIQFVLNAEECCDYIADAINRLTLGLANLAVNASFANIKKVNCWTLEEAINMEAAGFRESYLPQKSGDGFHSKYAFADAVYRANGPAIRKRKREQVIEDEIEREKQRVLRLNIEEESRGKYRFMDDDNDLPF